MVVKRFRTRTYRSNLIAWIYVCGIVGLVAFLVTAMTGWFLLLPITLGIAFLGAAIAWWRDQVPQVNYILEEEHLTLERAGVKRTIPLAQIMDANVLDRASARDYVRQTAHSVTVEGGSPAKAQAALLHFCTLDIGLRSFSFGIGRSFTDHMPKAKEDLVIIRLRNGEQLLLSPAHQNEMIAAIANVLHRRPRSAA